MLDFMSTFFAFCARHLLLWNLLGIAALALSLLSPLPKRKTIRTAMENTFFVAGICTIIPSLFGTLERSVQVMSFPNIVIWVVAALIVILIINPRIIVKFTKIAIIKNICGLMPMIALLLIYALGIAVHFCVPAPAPDPPALSVRIAAISKNLSALTNELSDIQTEIQQRIDLARQLEQQIRDTEAKLALTQEQSEMFDRLVQNELAKTTAANAWLTVGFGVVSIVASAALGVGFTHVYQKRKNPPKTINHNKSR